MKRIIDGKRYNTETATEIADVSNNIQDVRNFRYECTTLYRTKSGRWFIAGKGGPMSRWAYSHGPGQGWSNGSGIQPIDAEEARELLERRNRQEALEQYFGKEIEDA